MVNVLIGVIFVAALFVAYGLVRSGNACDGQCLGCEADCQFRIPREGGEATRERS